MSNIYFEASTLLLTHKAGSLKSRIYSTANASTNSRASPARLYALIMETLRHKDILNEVIRKSGILGIEKKLNPTLALLLLHDFLLLKPGKDSISLAVTHPLRAAILRHKARLSSEFTRARLRKGYATTEALIEAFKTIDSDGSSRIPRWVRANRLKTTLSGLLSASPFDTFTAVDTIEELFDSKLNGKVYYIDKHIPDLVAFPPSITPLLTKHHLYASGSLILQDKASCFPAYILNPPPGAHVVDACAAPGNKTTHLAAIMAANAGCKGHGKGKITAFERDPRRSEILEKMTQKAGADEIVRIKKATDFMKSNPASDPHLGFVTHLLLDPSCSGSGITSREQLEDRVTAYTPLPVAAKPTQLPSNKRKRGKAPEVEAKIVPTVEEDEAPAEEDDAAVLSARLTTLSSFQLVLLLHALSYPHARRITYSTCSIHAQENEHVVTAALLSPVARKRGWKMDTKLDMMGGWGRRGIVEEVRIKAEELGSPGHGGEDWAEDVAKGCVRCDEGDNAGGFFVACFIRDVGEDEEAAVLEKPCLKDEEEEEWNGIAGDDDGTQVQTEPTKKPIKNVPSNKKKGKGGQGPTAQSGSTGSSTLTSTPRTAANPHGQQNAKKKKLKSKH
ncbi:S-adenosyl-L-methionine-dependent methyltransferase [Peziza echinospora]|nr:S-adenosyl-L-methionine-dependent methyltransferase [Peziza echinospora]